MRQWLDELSEDVKVGLRQLAGAPFFTFVAVLTLALGVGANAAIFGVTKSVLLDALPYAEPDRLVRVWGGVRVAPQIGPLTAGTIADITARQRSFTNLAAFDGASEGTLDLQGGPEAAVITWVEPRLLQTLGVVPRLGRTFAPDEGGNGLVPLSGGELGPDTARVAILSDAAWRRHFSADPGAIGRSVGVNGLVRTIVGVLPSGYVGPMGEADVYLPLDLAPVAAHPVFSRGSGWLGLVARLRPDVTPEAARGEVAAIWSDLAERYPDENAGLGIALVPLREAMVGDTRAPLLVLLASAGLVLLITCANLAAALLSRALTRRKEFAVRMAVGAGRGRLVRQLLTESMLLAVSGGTAGLVLATLALRTAAVFARPMLPDYADLTLDWGAIATAATIAVVTGVLFGIAPAMAAGRSESHSALRDESRRVTESRRSRQLRGLLMAVQIALCVSVLSAAGLLLRSLWEINANPIGIVADGVLTATVQLPPAVYPTPAAMAQFHDRFLERLRALPGVDAAASTTALPTTDIGMVGMTIEGAPTPDSGQPFVPRATVSDAYFITLGIPLLAGRTFTNQDRRDGLRVVVISQSMARRYWPSGGVIGARVRLGPNPNAPWTEVIGIVGDVRNNRARAEAEPMLYFSTRQLAPRPVRVLLRTPGNPLGLVAPMQRILAELDRGLPLREVATLSAVLDEGLTNRRLPTQLMLGFGALALLLASVGVYAMFASVTASREREFGIRMALGSRPRQIGALVLRQGGGWMVVGFAGGALGIVAMAPFVSSLLYGVAPFDPTTLAAAVGILLACATIALLIPARRATRVDPADVLRV